MIDVDAVFAGWNAAIMGSLRRRFYDVPVATLEDGAAFAWAQLAKKPPPDDYAALAWLQVVARNEVLRLLRRWERPVELAGAAYDDSDEGRLRISPRTSRRLWVHPEEESSEWLDEQVEARDLLRRVGDLRPGQRTALTCKLLGLTYKEAQEATGHTYTWVNRHITEGRRALLEQLEVAA